MPGIEGSIPPNACGRMVPIPFMQIRILILCVLSSLFLLQCSSVPPTSHPEEAIFADRPPDSITGDGSLLFQQAQEFDKLVRGKSSDAGWQQLKENCRHPSGQNPFCSSISRYAQIRDLRQVKLQVRVPLPGKPVNPVTPEVRGETITNIATLRKSPVDGLLKGLMTLNEDLLKKLGHSLAKEKRCPNNAAIAVAATLEDYLPDQAPLDLIARLYEKGGVCARQNPVDRENFYTRSALFHIWGGSWTQAERVLTRARANDAFNGRVAYWLFRAKHHQKKTDEAEKILSLLSRRHVFSFHHLVASKMLEVDPGLNILSSREIVAKTSNNPPLKSLIHQIQILKKFGFDFSAAILVDWALARFHRLDPEVRLHLVSLGDPPAKVAQVPFILLSKPSLESRTAMELMYPKPFFKEFTKNSRGLDPYLLLSIARKESRFNPLAVSPANAQGLMQLNPETAARIGGKDLNLMDVPTSIDLAARHLQEHLSEFKNNLSHSIAAYNAGDEQVKSWIKRFRVSDPILFIDLIPYRETRDYTAFVLANYFWYQRLYGDRPFDNLPSP